MSHSSQIVEVRIRRGGRVGETPVEVVKAFVGEPQTPLTDDDVKAALWDAIDQAMAYLEEYAGELVDWDDIDEVPRVEKEDEDEEE